SCAPRCVGGEERISSRRAAVANVDDAIPGEAPEVQGRGEASAGLRLRRDRVGAASVRPGLDVIRNTPGERRRVRAADVHVAERGAAVRRGEATLALIYRVERQPGEHLAAVGSAIDEDCAAATSPSHTSIS